VAPQVREAGFPTAAPTRRCRSARVRKVYYRLDDSKRKPLTPVKQIATPGEARIAAQKLVATLRAQSPEKLATQSDPDAPITTRTIQRVIEALSIRAGIPHVNPHAIRHAFATHLLDGGADIFTISKLLGHETVNTTAIYLHVSQKNLAATMERCHPRSEKGENA
jgi:site-specific recombinase XerD